MKFLINSAYLHKLVLQAIDNEAQIVYFSNSDFIQFIAKDPDKNISMQVHPLEKSGDHFSFITQKWQRVADFLKMIPEQPITVKLYSESIDINCEACFRLQ
jgi:hypothetical protein